jgi:ATPase subunit of ABC transporter with duplicated ATPase domains
MAGAQEEYEHMGGHSFEAQAREVLHALGFEDDQIDCHAGALSGGWKMRVALARLCAGSRGFRRSRGGTTRKLSACEFGKLAAAN